MAKMLSVGNWEIDARMAAANLHTKIKSIDLRLHLPSVPGVIEINWTEAQKMLQDE